MERRGDERRTVIMTPHYLKHPEGSCLIEVGDTKVLCTATVETKVPDWMRGQGAGWVTAEYAMLPRATASRTRREGQFGRWPAGRTMEIQRFIGRCLRAAVWRQRMGEITVTVDCDVLQADGGTRTAAVTGGWVALALALDKVSDGCGRRLIKRHVAATSVGIVNGQVVADLCYAQDAAADVDLNLAADERGTIVDVQATAEGEPFSKERLDEMIALGMAGVQQLIAAQRSVLASVGIDVAALVDAPVPQ